MPTPIRLRHDSIIAAQEAAHRLAGGNPCAPGWVTDAEAAATPPAEPGDCWRIIHGAYDGKPGSTAGYAICCPTCRQIHYWTHARNCSSRRELPTGWIGRGPRRRMSHGGTTCDHEQARTSCWTWTVDADGRPIRARASLFVSHPDGCGYHGWLDQDGKSPGILSDG